MSSNSFIPLSVPNISDHEWSYVRETIETGWVSSVGTYVDRFEEAFAEYIGAKYAIAVMNGTSALHIALRLCDVGQGDEVLVPNLTFVAPANAVRYCHANPVFMDSQWSNLSLDIEKVQSFLKHETYFTDGKLYNKRSGARIKAIIPMHTHGYPVEMIPLNEVCSEYGIPVIEDATESLGSIYHGIRTGNFSRLACFSFNGNKIMTSGGGGMIVTNDEALAKRAKHLTTTAKKDPVEYYHDEIGYNYRLVNVLAALGLAQLERMDEFLKAKRDNHAVYKQLLSDSDRFYLHSEPANMQSNYWLYTLVLNSKIDDHKKLAEKFADNQIQVRPIWKLMTDLPMYRGSQSYHCEVSRDIYNRVISIPCSTNITREEITRVSSAIHNIFR